MPAPIRLFLVLILLLNGLQALEPRPRSIQSAILGALDRMPESGSYRASSAATRAMESSMGISSGLLWVEPARATPSYCSSATYLVFLAALQSLGRDGSLNLEPERWNALLARGQRDGEGIWGRWNANGPGTARLFAELNLGRNFSAWSEAQRGDFMKIFWTTEIGVKEHGHSVIYLGTESVDGVEQVRFWSSNQPLGYGFKSVPKTKIAQVVFSRLEHPENLSRSLPGMDRYLAGLLSKRSTWAELLEKCAMSRP